VYAAAALGVLAVAGDLLGQAALAQGRQGGRGRGAGPGPAAAVTLPEPGDPAVGILHVQGNVYLVNLGDVNVTAQVGDDGILLVDSGPADMSDQLIAALEARFEGKRIRQLINTHYHPDHTGGNAAIAAAASGGGGRGGGQGGGGGRGGGGLRIIAHENTLNRMSGVHESDPERPAEERPTSTFFGAKKEIHFNGEPIEIIHQPSAHTDGDVLVFFRGSDVISVGDNFSTTSYPMLDLERGSTYQGVLDALNRMLDITVPRFNQQGGTRVIPGHGRLSNESDVDDYRNWMTIVRDRIRAMVAKNMTLQEVKAADPTLDYDAIFSTPRWTTDMFVEAVYTDLSAAAKASQSARVN
jgi:glyoxylase-like metal-dependent hydrolase (beta-lactamase superfamily II)